MLPPGMIGWPPALAVAAAPSASEVARAVMATVMVNAVQAAALMNETWALLAHAFRLSSTSVGP